MVHFSWLLMHSSCLALLARQSRYILLQLTSLIALSHIIREGLMVAIKSVVSMHRIGICYRYIYIDTQWNYDTCIHKRLNNEGDCTVQGLQSI